MKQLLDDEIRYDGSRSAALLEMLREFVRNSCAGRRCPSHWQLAGKYNVSRSTVEKVYQQLAIEGLVEQRRGSGTFVAGRRVVHFLMPGADLLTRQDSNGVTVRQRLEGCVTAARERGMSVELMYLSPQDDALNLDCRMLANLNASAMVVLQDWFFAAFPVLAQRALRCALISSGNVPYGAAQHIRQWQQLLIDRGGGVQRALELLYAAGCRRVAIAGHYIDYCRAWELTAYRKFVQEHNMPCLELVLKWECSSYDGQWRQAVRQLYMTGKFDGLLIFCREYLAAQHSLHEFLGLPESVRLLAWNFYPELAPGVPPVGSFNPPNRQLGYDAVTRMLDDTRSCRKNIYKVQFENLPPDLQEICDKLSGTTDAQLPGD